MTQPILYRPSSVTIGSMNRDNLCLFPHKLQAPLQAGLFLNFGNWYAVSRKVYAQLIWVSSQTKAHFLHPSRLSVSRLSERSLCGSPALTLIVCLLPCYLSVVLHLSEDPDLWVEHRGWIADVICWSLKSFWGLWGNLALSNACRVKGGPCSCVSSEAGCVGSPCECRGLGLEHFSV